VEEEATMMMLGWDGLCQIFRVSKNIPPPHTHVFFHIGTVEQRYGVCVCVCVCVCEIISVVKLSSSGKLSLQQYVFYQIV
jgi:hypothetical protein